ncbi:unnamed protein product [Camellia sinensis]
MQPQGLCAHYLCCPSLDRWHAGPRPGPNSFRAVFARLCTCMSSHSGQRHSWAKRDSPGDRVDLVRHHGPAQISLSKVIWENKEGVSNGVPHVIYISREKRPKHLHHFKAGAMNILGENKEGVSNGVPHVIYISREKRPKYLHHFKAGAMNILTRVSGVITNAPFMLNLDCDIYVNNPQIVVHAMCLLLGVTNERDCAFVQSPQIFYDGLKDDPFGNQMVVLFHGIQGPLYGGTRCFHRRKVIYGLSPDDNDITRKLSKEALLQTFGRSMEFTKSAAAGVERLAGCMDLQQKMSLLDIPSMGGAGNLPFVHLTHHGCAPPGGPATMIQQKRWATGPLEILFTPKNTFILTLNGKLQFRQCLAYTCVVLWGLRSIPELCYAAPSAYCLITDSHFMPKVGEPVIFIPIAVFAIYNLYTLSEYLRIGPSTRAWWNNQRIWRLNTMIAWLFGVLGVLLKLLGLSDTIFEVTQNDQSTNVDDNNANAGRFTCEGSPSFVLGTTILLVNLTALAIGLLRFQLVGGDGNGSGIGEFICSMWVVLCFWAFLRGLFAKGKYGIPSATIHKSGALALLFLQLCKWV